VIMAVDGLTLRPAPQLTYVPQQHLAQHWLQQLTQSCSSHICMTLLSGE